jgi:hypothetical protein
MRTRDPGWKKFGSGIRNNHPGSATLIPVAKILITGMVRNGTERYCIHEAVLRIHDILGWIRIRIWIRGSMPQTVYLSGVLSKSHQKELT